MLSMLPTPSQWKEVKAVFETLIALIVSVMAGVIADRICKWLDGN